MHISQFLAGAFALTAGAFAFPQRAGSGNQVGYSSSLTNQHGGTSTRCYTRMSSTRPQSSPVTTWSTSLQPCVTTTTVTTKITVTPAAVTTTMSTTIQTTSTAPTSTSTATVISSTTTTTTSITTTTTTSVSTTSTGVVATVLVAPASGPFSPVQSTLPLSSYSGTGGAIFRREDENIAQRSELVDRAQDQWSRNYTSNSYAQSYQCVAYMPGQCSIVTSILTSTMSAATPTSTITKSTTQTNTVYPSATTTVTSSSTITAQSVITSVATSISATTNTVVTSTYTSYLACATNNFADQIDGTDIGDWLVDPSTKLENLLPATGAEDCCISSNQFSSVATGQYWLYYNSQCYSWYGSFCPAQSGNTGSTFTYRGQNEYAYTVGNMGCGEWNHNTASS